jgi:hypothetical protein
MSDTYVVVEDSGQTLLLQDPALAPTIIEVITEGPVGPAGPRGEGLKIDAAVSSAAALPAVGTSGQSILDASTGVIYTWRAA